MSVIGTNGRADCIARGPLSGASGKHLLAASISPFDPTETWAWPTS